MINGCIISTGLGWRLGPRKELGAFFQQRYGWDLLAAREYFSGTVLNSGTLSTGVGW